MGNLFAYYVATSLVDPIANRYQLRSQKKNYRKPYVGTSYDFSLSLHGDTDSTESNSCDSSVSSENHSKDEFISSLPQGAKLERMYVPYIEPPTIEALVERREILTAWVQRHKLFFPRDNVEMVIDSSYPLGANVFDALKSCPFQEIDVEFRFTNLALFDGESWNSFCARVKHLKLYKCRMNSAILYGIVMNAKKMISLRLIMPVIPKCDFCVTLSLVQLAPKKRPALQSLTYCGSDVDIFEPFLTLLLSIYPHIVDFKLYLKLLPYTSSSIETNSPLDGKIISTLKVCNAICTRLMTSPKKIRSLDLKLSDGNPADGCQIIPIVTMLYIPELIWLSKVSFYVHEELDYELFQALGNLRLLRSVKWSLNFHESGSFTYNCCIFSLTSFPQLRTLKIVHSKCFSLEIELLDLLASSQLKKFHVNAESVRVERSCENCSFLIPNRTLRDLKIRVNNFSLVSNQFYEISRFMKILLRAFNKLRVLQFTPVKDAVMEHIIQYQPQLEELNVELYHCSYSLFARLPAQTAERRIPAICDLRNLTHLTITDVDGELDIGIFSFVKSEQIKSLKLFGRQLHVMMVEQDELVGKYFKKFRELNYFQYNSYLYVLDPFIQCPRKIFMVDKENYFSDDYAAEGDFTLIDSIEVHIKNNAR